MGLGITKVEVDGLGVTDVQNTVRLGGEPGDHLTSSDAQMFLEQIHGLGSNDIAFSLVILTCRDRQREKKRVRDGERERKTDAEGQASSYVYKRRLSNSGKTFRMGQNGMYMLNSKSEFGLSMDCPGHEHGSML